MAISTRVYIVAAGTMAAAGVFALMQRAEAPSNGSQVLPTGALVEVVLPAVLSGNQGLGKTAFDAKCAVCHGINASGRDGAGPPLVHKIYEPGHHGDASFLMAARRGVRGHHWPFGDMPPIDGLTDDDIGNIVAYVRALQRKNGIN